MGVTRVFKAYLALIHVRFSVALASILLVLVPAYLFLVSLLTEVFGAFYPVGAGQAGSLEEVPLPAGEVRVFIGSMSRFFPWIFSVLFAALLVNTLAEGSFRRQLDYAIAYTGSPTLSLLATSLALTFYTLPQAAALSLAFSIVCYAVLGWDLGVTLGVWLYMLLSTLTLLIALSSITSYIRAPHNYWLIVIAYIASLHVAVLARPGVIRLVTPIAGLIDYLEVGRLSSLIAPPALHLAIAFLVYAILWYRR